MSSRASYLPIDHLPNTNHHEIFSSPACLENSQTRCCLLSVFLCCFAPIYSLTYFLGMATSVDLIENQCNPSVDFERGFGWFTLTVHTLAMGLMYRVANNSNWKADEKKAFIGTVVLSMQPITLVLIGLGYATECI